MDKITDTDICIKEYEKQYSEEKFWSKVTTVAKKAGIKVIYMALLLYYALDSTSLSVKDRALIIGALGYFILPLDLVSDLMPAIGFLDDAAIDICHLQRIGFSVLLYLNS